MNYHNIMNHYNKLESDSSTSTPIGINNIGTFTLYPHYEQTNQIRQNFMLTLYQLKMAIECLVEKQCRKSTVIIPNVVSELKIVNIKNIIDLYNKMLEKIVSLYNECIGILNKTVPKHNFKTVTPTQINLNSYDMLLSNQLISFLTRLRTDITSIYRDMIKTIDALSNIKSIEELEAEMEQKFNAQK